MNTPRPGARYHCTETPGVDWTAVNVRAGDALFVSDTGERRTVYRAQWPGPFSLVPGEDATGAGTTTHAIEALLVGGAEGKHLDRIRRLAAEQNVHVYAHVSGDVERTGAIPGDVELVILLSSHMSHAHYNVYKENAKAAGLPFVSVYSNGFASELAAELIRIKGPGKESMGAMAAAVPIDDPYWEWMDGTWELHAPRPNGWTDEDQASPPSRVEGSNSGTAIALASLLAGGTILALIG